MGETQTLFEPKKPKQFLNAYEIIARLEKKYAPPSWAFFTEVKSSVGLPLGDASLMYGMQLPICEKCGEALEPKIFFGHIYGWRCNRCQPVEVKSWSAKKVEGKK